MSTGGHRQAPVGRVDTGGHRQAQAGTGMHSGRHSFFMPTRFSFSSPALRCLCGFLATQLPERKYNQQQEAPKNLHLYLCSDLQLSVSGGLTWWQFKTHQSMLPLTPPPSANAGLAEINKEVDIDYKAVTFM